MRVVKLGGKDCDFEGGKICNGAVTKEIGTKLVKVCVDGKIKTRTRKSVGEGFPLVGRDTGEGKGNFEEALSTIFVAIKGCCKNPYKTLIANTLERKWKLHSS